MATKVEQARRVRKLYPVLSAQLVIRLVKLVKSDNEYSVLWFVEDCLRWAASPHDDNMLLHVVHTMCRSRSPRPHRLQMLQAMDLGCRDTGTGHGANKRGWLWQYLAGAELIRAELYARHRTEILDRIKRVIPEVYAYDLQGDYIYSDYENSWSLYGHKNKTAAYRAMYRTANEHARVWEQFLA